MTKDEETVAISAKIAIGATGSRMISDEQENCAMALARLPQSRYGHHFLQEDKTQSDILNCNPRQGWTAGVSVWQREV
jgi:hypothetical protein